MQGSQKNIIRGLERFIEKHSIDIVKYNLNSPSWWKGRKAILIRKYKNICGEVIQKEAMVCILFPMQFIRFEEVVHCGDFFVRDLKTGVCIGGINYQDLILTGQKIKVSDYWPSIN